MKWQSVVAVISTLLSVTFIVYVEVRRWLKSRRRWFIKRASPDVPDISDMVKSFEKMEKTMGATFQSVGLKMPKMPDIQGVFEEWYDSETGKWSPIQYGAVGFKTREEAETAMASLIILDPNQMGKMEVVKQ